MDRNKLLRRLTYLVFFIFIFNLAAMKFYWYSSLWWFDMPMHFLGGLWLGLAVVWLLRVDTKPFGRGLWTVLLGVLLVGVLWEIFEVIFYNHLAGNPFDLVDTLSDLCFDLAGGLSGYLIYCYTYLA